MNKMTINEQMILDKTNDTWETNNNWRTKSIINKQTKPDE